MLAFFESIDVAIFRFINHAAGNPIVAHAAYYLDVNYIGNILLMGSFWYFWFKPGANRRPEILSSIVGIMVAILAARLLASSLPFRIRPVYVQDAGFIAPHVANGLSSHSPGEDWSSFPSDTATLFFAQAYGLWRQSKLVGATAFVLAAAQGMVARVVLSIHYPADTIVGATIGIAFVAITCAVLAPRITSITRMFCTDAKQYMYFLLFCLTCEITNLFGDVLQVMRGVRYALRTIGIQVGLFQVVLIIGFGILGVFAIVSAFVYTVRTVVRDN